MTNHMMPAVKSPPCGPEKKHTDSNKETPGPPTRSAWIHGPPQADMMLTPQLLCLLGLLALGAAHAIPWSEERMDNGSCPMFWTAYDGRCYKHIPLALSWNEAQRNCQVTYSHPWLICELVSVRNQEEHDFVLSLAPKDDPTFNGHTWIGLNDLYVEGIYTWPDGSKVNYTPWGKDEPSGSPNYNCVYTSGGQWYDDYCAYDKHSVCVLRMP